MPGFDPETAENNQDVEHHWALKAIMHAETYFKMLTSLPSLKLTKHDDLLYVSFKQTFPELNVKVITENDLKNDAAKLKWREFIEKHQHLVEDYNFGTLLRINSEQDYSEENSFFVTRIVFVCVEIARIKEGFNKVLYKNEELIMKHEGVDEQDMEKEMKILQDKITSNLE
jgi:hypothetical protein